MEPIGIDVHKNQNQICILTPGGELIERRISTERPRFEAVLTVRPAARIPIEASTESEWVARDLERLGHEVIVADPNYAPMYAERTRRVKTDRRDARTLAEASRLGAYRPAHWSSDASRHVRGWPATRKALVGTRTKFISLTRALLRREGLRIRSGSASTFLQRLAELDLPRPQYREIAPLLRELTHLNAEIQKADEALRKHVRQNPTAERLCTAPGVGPVTATSFAATPDRADRFHGAHQVEAYLGLVPRENSSGDHQRKGRITKTGDRRTRSLLVEAAWATLRQDRHLQFKPLRE